MSNGPDLPTILAELDAQISAANRELAAANQDIQTANDALRESTAALHQLDSQITDINQKIVLLSAQATGERAQMETKLNELRVAHGDAERTIAAKQISLNTILSYRRVETAQAELERQQGLGLLRIQAGFHATRSGPGRYLFALRAAQAIAERGITPNKFHTFSDGSKAYEILTELENAKTTVNERDRHEVERLNVLQKIAEDVRALSFADAKHRTEFARSEADLMKSQADLTSKISSLEQPETPTDARKRKTYLSIALVAGILFVIIGLVTLDSIGLFFLALALFAFIFAWTQRAGGRKSALQTSQQQLVTATEQLNALRSRNSDYVSDIDRKLGEVRSGLDSLGARIEPHTVLEGQIFNRYFDATNQLLQSWFTKYPDASLALGTLKY